MIISIQYKLLYGLFRIIGVNKMLDKKGADFDKLLENCRKTQGKPLKVPYKKMAGFDIGKDMMHCWGAMEFVPEAKAVRQEYFKALQWPENCTEERADQ